MRKRVILSGHAPSPCATGSFTDGDNKDTCIKWDECEAGEMDMSLNGPGYDSDRQCVKCMAGRFSTGTQVRDLGVHSAYLRVVWVKHIDLVPLKSHRRRTSATTPRRS